MPLETQLAFYESIQPDLLKHYEGKIALVIGKEHPGVFDKGEDAYQRGIELRGNVPMLIRKVQAVEPIEHIPAIVLGLLNARSNSFKTGPLLD